MSVYELDIKKSSLWKRRKLLLKNKIEGKIIIEKISEFDKLIIKNLNKKEKIKQKNININKSKYLKGLNVVNLNEQFLPNIYLKEKYF
tara:strand:+ start:3970 stop:4233 length:264 start_codon:yes stop_codon:yes gene_type:complete